MCNKKNKCCGYQYNYADLSPNIYIYIYIYICIYSAHTCATAVPTQACAHVYLEKIPRVRSVGPRVRTFTALVHIFQVASLLKASKMRTNTSAWCTLYGALFSRNTLICLLTGKPADCLLDMTALNLTTWQALRIRTDSQSTLA
jgi:hypothetical protein